MRRGQYIFAAVAVSVAGAAGGIAAWAALRPATTFGNTGVAAVRSTIVLDPHLRGEVFAPPPADASPTLTAQQALDTYLHKPGMKTAINVRLGLFHAAGGRCIDLRQS